MMSVKGGTQTWSKATQESSLKGDNTRTNSAVDANKYFDGEAVGDTANKITDPNWVDPSKKMRTVGNAELGKDAFMSLLLTQMKNQDPTNPLKSHEMAAQLAQFTSLEKLNNINEGINNLRKDNQPDHNFQALQFIGKTVSMDNSKIMRQEEGESHELRFSLPQDSQKTTIEIKDANGAVIRKIEAKNLKTGPNTIAWNGKTEEGSTAPKGDYSMSIEAWGSNGRKLAVQTKADGVITGVNFTAQGPQLMIGKQVISLADVKSISDPNVGAQNQIMQALAGAMPGQPQQQQQQGQSQSQPKAQPQNQPQSAQAPSAPAGSRSIAIPPELQGGAAAAPSAGLQPAGQEPKGKMEVKPETKGNEAKRARLAKGTVNDSAMSQGLINTLNKEGAKAGMGT